ncbi:hypothetical protein DXG01_007000 [Tephrocybe rancida]|nr:hypothetical protein DXG01_007000 [Tephrocybe rancida]
MARKPITYAHKRNRNKRTSVLRTESSPIQDIANPEEELAYSEMSRRMLKRSRQTWKGTSGSARAAEDKADQPNKKLKLNGQDIRKSSSVTSGFPTRQYELQTPHHTVLTEELVFRIESSRGGPLPSDYEFSPVPPVSFLDLSKQQTPAIRGVDQGKKSSQKTSSSSLKENAVPTFIGPSLKSKSGTSDTAAQSSRPKSKLSAYRASLASPFASKPSSPQPLSTETFASQAEPIRLSKSSLKRTLSDTHYNPNIPSHRAHLPTQSQSTLNSPVRYHEDGTSKARRPSAPCSIAQRPNVTSWFPSYSSTTAFCDQVMSSSEPFLSGLRTREIAVDFNRPPSQLSYNFEYDEAFFGDALEISTPFGPKAERPSAPTFSESPDSTDEDDDDQHSPDGTLRSSEMQITRPLSLHSGHLGSWLSDSLISPPSIHKSAYSQPPFNEDVDMTSPRKPSTSCQSFLGLDETKDIRLSHELPEDGGRTAPLEDPEPLQELFDRLELSFDDGMYWHARPDARSRTRSLDLEPDRSSGEQSLQSPARISPSKTKAVHVESVAKRDRRGTIRASDFPVPGSSVLGGPRRTRSGTVVQGPTRPRRERSDTVVARPPNSVLLGCAATSSGVGDVDMADVTSDAGHKDVGDVSMTVDERDDELLLKDHWVDEDWAVAAPPSPVLPRRKNGIPEWRKRFELKRASGAWSIGHSVDNGESDLLLLR